MSLSETLSLVKSSLDILNELALILDSVNSIEHASLHELVLYHGLDVLIGEPLPLGSLLKHLLSTLVLVCNYFICGTVQFAA